MNTYNPLEEKIKKMQECQENTQKKLSCMDCENMLECDIRMDYVKAVYDNMSQGTSKNFNF